MELLLTKMDYILTSCRKNLLRFAFVVINVPFTCCLTSSNFWGARHRYISSPQYVSNQKLFSVTPVSEIYFTEALDSLLRNVAPSEPLKLNADRIPFKNRCLDFLLILQQHCLNNLMVDTSGYDMVNQKLTFSVSYLLTHQLAFLRMALPRWALNKLRFHFFAADFLL